MAKKEFRKEKDTAKEQQWNKLERCNEKTTLKNIIVHRKIQRKNNNEINCLEKERKKERIRRNRHRKEMRGKVAGKSTRKCEIRRLTCRPR